MVRKKNVPRHENVLGTTEFDIVQQRFAEIQQSPTKYFFRFTLKQKSIERSDSEETENNPRISSEKMYQRRRKQLSKAK